MSFDIGRITRLPCVQLMIFLFHVGNGLPDQLFERRFMNVIESLYVKTRTARLILAQFFKQRIV